MAMMSSGKARRENAELERQGKRRPQSLQRNRWPPSWVVPSLVTLTDSQRGHDINTSSWSQPTRPTLLQENRLDCPQDSPAAGTWDHLGDQLGHFHRFAFNGQHSQHVLLERRPPLELPGSQAPEPTTKRARPRRL